MSNDANKINFVDKTIMTTLQSPSSESYEWVYQGGDLESVGAISL